MITKQDPTQPLLLSRFRNLLSAPALKALDAGWQGVFHRMALRQLPVQKIEKDFNPVTGRPTKELYSVCGLLLMMDFFTGRWNRLGWRIQPKIEDALDEMLSGMGVTFVVSKIDLPKLKKCKGVVHYQ